MHRSSCCTMISYQRESATQFYRIGYNSLHALQSLTLKDMANIWPLGLFECLTYRDPVHHRNHFFPTFCPQGFLWIVTCIRLLSILHKRNFKTNEHKLCSTLWPMLYRGWNLYDIKWSDSLLFEHELWGLDVLCNDTATIHFWTIWRFISEYMLWSTHEARNGEKI